MKAALICPSEREAVPVLAEAGPLALAPVLGKTLLEYWLEHFVTQGAREVFVLTGDRAQQICGVAGDGARWGLRVKVLSELREPDVSEARAKLRESGDADWLAAPLDVVLADRLPQQPERSLFESYAGWFAALKNWLPHAATEPGRIGMREIRPGVWAGLNPRIASDAEFRAPCWLGHHVFVGSGAVIGPGAVIEDGSFIESGAKISESVICPETFVGKFTEVCRSIAWGNTLVNWELGSCLKVPDAFLLGPVKSPRPLLLRTLQPFSVGMLQPLWSWKFNTKTEP